MFDAQRFKCCADADDIDDRVERTNFVQLDVGRIDAVNCTFDRSQPFEDRAGPSTHPGGKIGRIEERKDLARRAMDMRSGLSRVLALMGVQSVVRDNVFHVAPTPHRWTRSKNIA